MKTLCKNIKSSLVFLLLFTFSLPSWSAETVKLTKKTEAVGLALTVQGEAFLVSDNRTKNLETSDYIYDFSEIVTSDNSQVTFKDNFDHKYHLAPGTHLKILNRIIELKSGYLWIKSESDEKGFTVQTANAKVAYSKGEAIVTFDVLAGKTQLLVVKGEMDFGNILLEENKVTVSDASFSFLLGDLEGSIPRPATGIGQASFLKVVSVFSGIKPEHGELALEHNQHMAKSEGHNEHAVASPKVERAVASVKEEVEEKKGPGKFVYIVKNKEEEEKKAKNLEKLYENNLVELEKSKPKKRKISYTPDYKTKSNVVVKMYGQKTIPQQRKPASIATPTTSNSFENLTRELHQKNESQDLIRQLNNFKAE